MGKRNISSYRPTAAVLRAHAVSSIIPADAIPHGTVAETHRIAEEWSKKHPNPFAPRRSGNKPPWNRGK